ncbi:MAG: sensor histidine kinase [Gemmatirosa sp.]
MASWRLPPLRWPTRWPTLLLLVSIGLTTLGVVEANRAIRSHEAVAGRALQDYAGFAAWSYQQHLREALGAMTHEALGAVNHGDDMHRVRTIPDARDLAGYLPFHQDCNCHRPLAGPSPAVFFGWVLGSDTLGVAANTHRDPRMGWGVDRLQPQSVPREPVAGYGAAERRWINDTITRHIRGTGTRWNFPLVVAARESTSRMLVYTLMPTTWGDTVVYGAEYTREAFAALLGSVMDRRGMLPATFTRGHATREVMTLEVTSARGDPLFASEPVRAWRLDESARLSPDFGALRVRAQIRPALAGSLVIGGLPRSRLPFLVGLLAVAAALALVAVGQTRREGELARMRGDFVDSISHELRTPLAQMRLYLETLRLGRFTTEAQRARSLDNVERETTRLSQLVERVLRFSRLGRDDDGARAPVDVGDEVARIVAEFAPLAAARRTTLAVDAAPVPSLLLLRPAALRHMLLNLLDNAVKYGPAGQTVQVRLRHDAGTVRLEVADEGPGVPAAERESVWRPYQRGSGARHAAGSGIGLAVVRDVAAQHGGRAWIEATPDARGATFVVALPADADVPVATPSHAVADRAPEPVHG